MKCIMGDTLRSSAAHCKQSLGMDVQNTLFVLIFKTETGYHYIMSIINLEELCVELQINYVQRPS